MAREETTSAQLRSLAAQLGAVVSGIDQMADQLDESKVPNVRLHLGTITNVLIPNVQHWFEVAKLNANDDVRAFLRGVESRSSIQKRHNDKRKLKLAGPESKVSRKRNK